MLQLFGFKKKRENQTPVQTTSTALAVSTNCQPVSSNAIKLRHNSQLPLFIGSPSSSDISVPDEKERLLKIIAQSEFADLPATVFDQSWLAQIPADWIIPPLEPFFEYLPVEEQHVEMLRELRWLLAVKCIETYDRRLSSYQFLNFLATEIIRHHDGICLDGSSGRTYTRSDIDTMLLRDSASAGTFTESPTPSLRPFLSVTATRYGERVWMTGHGLARFDLPELEIDCVEPDLAEPTVYLLNGLAQALIERVIDAREAGESAISLDELFAVSTDAIVNGNRGDMPFSACVPRTESIKLKLVHRESGRRLNPDYHSPSETNAVLRRMLTNLSLLPG